jgi:hypothetical protein
MVDRDSTPHEAIQTGYHLPKGEAGSTKPNESLGFLLFNLTHNRDSAEIVAEHTPFALQGLLSQ